MNTGHRWIGTAVFLLLSASLTAHAQVDSGVAPQSNEQHLSHLIEAARSYDRGLPNFVCTEVVHRSKDSTGAGSHWKEYDNYEVELTYVQGQERLRLVKLNGKAPGKDYEQLGGYRSEGLFGDLPSWIFRPEAKTEFTFLREEKVGQRAVRVYEYRVPQERSGWLASPKDARGRYLPGSIPEAFHGTVSADSAVDSIFRIDAVLDSEPDTQASVEYDDVEVSGKQARLPIKAEVRTVSGKELLRNVIEYREFHRYAADTSVSFEVQTPNGASQ